MILLTSSPSICISSIVESSQVADQASIGISVYALLNKETTSSAFLAGGVGAATEGPTTTNEIVYSFVTEPSWETTTTLASPGTVVACVIVMLETLVSVAVAVT